MADAASVGARRRLHELCNKARFSGHRGPVAQILGVFSLCVCRLIDKPIDDRLRSKTVQLVVANGVNVMNPIRKTGLLQHVIDVRRILVVRSRYQEKFTRRNRADNISNVVQSGERRD